MLKKHRTIAAVMGLAAPLSLMVGLTAANPACAAAEDKGYVESSAEEVVKTGTGECWKSVGGVQELKEECGDVMPVAEEPEPMMAPADSDGDGVMDDRDKCPGTPMGAKVDKDGCEIMASLTIDLVADEFAFDSAQLTPEMETALDDVAEKMINNRGDETLLIIGHTDSVGPEDYNQGLSERRAQAAADYLVGKGVAADKVTAEGRGESQPVADNSTKEGRAQNRRIEIQTR